MKNPFIFIIYILPLFLFSQKKNSLWQQEVDYSMVIDVDVESHTYTGTQT